MQPEPLVYLLAIRRELQSAQLFGDGLSSGASPVIAYRAGEGLLHVALRSTTLPTLLLSLRSRYVTVLQDVASALERESGRSCKEIQEALAAASADNSRDGAIAVHDLIELGIAAGLRALCSATSEADDAVRRLCADVVSLENECRNEYAAMLRSLTPAAAAPPSPNLAAPSPMELTSASRKNLEHYREVQVTNVERRAGFNSKDIFWLDIENGPDWSKKSVLRREPAYNVTGALVADEWPLLNRLRDNGVAVPKVLYAKYPNDGAPGYIITGRLQGRPYEPGTLGGAARAVLLSLARMAAHFHQTPVSDLARFCGQAGDARTRTVEIVQHFYERWLQYRQDDSAIIEASYRWLLCNAHRATSRVGLVHGDFNLRNVLIHEGAVSAVLDWELSHLGDPAEDLAHLRPDLGDDVAWSEFLGEYNAHATAPISQEAVDYFGVYAAFWQAVISSVTYSGYFKGMHDNFIFASTGFAEYRFYQDMLASRIERFR